MKEFVRIIINVNNKRVAVIYKNYLLTDIERF